MSGSSLARCLLVEGREQSTATQFWMRASTLALAVLASGWGIKKGHDGHQVTAFACLMMRGDTANSIWGSVRQSSTGSNLIWQGQVLHLPGLSSYDKVICTSPINISLFWDRRKRRPTDHHTSVISLPCFFWLIKMSSQWVPGLHISPEGAGYCTRIIIKLFVSSQIILMQSWIEKECNCIGMQKWAFGVYDNDVIQRKVIAGMSMQSFTKHFSEHDPQ